MSVLNLRRDVRKQANQAAVGRATVGQRTINTPGLRGQLPRTAGTLVLSDREKKNLAALGWKEGDPLPSQLSNVVAEEMGKIEEEIATIDPKPKSAFKMPRIQSISELPPEHQARLRKATTDYKQQMQAYQESEELIGDISHMDPSVQEAIRYAAGQPIEVVDSRLLDAGPGLDKTDYVPPEQEDKTFAERMQFGQKVNPEPEFQKTQDMAPPPVVVITETDKINYLVSVHGDKPFMKEYKFFNGTLSVILRELSNYHSEQALAYLRQKQMNNDILFVESYAELMKARLLFGIVTIRSSNDVWNVANAIDEPHAKEGDRVGVDHLLGEVQKAIPILQRETVWRLLQRTYDTFNRLVETLESKASEEGFWPAVEV